MATEVKNTVNAQSYTGIRPPASDPTRYQAPTESTPAQTSHDGMSIQASTARLPSLLDPHGILNSGGKSDPNVAPTLSAPTRQNDREGEEKNAGNRLSRKARREEWWRKQHAKQLKSPDQRRALNRSREAITPRRAILEVPWDQQGVLDKRIHPQRFGLNEVISKEGIPKEQEQAAHHKGSSVLIFRHSSGSSFIDATPERIETSSIFRPVSYANFQISPQYYSASRTLEFRKDKHNDTQSFRRYISPEPSDMTEDLYRRKIEALRGDFSKTWLSASDDENWNSTAGSTASDPFPNDATPVIKTAIVEAHSDQEGTEGWKAVPDFTGEAVASQKPYGSLHNISNPDKMLNLDCDVDRESPSAGSRKGQTSSSMISTVSDPKTDHTESMMEREDRHGSSGLVQAKVDDSHTWTHIRSEDLDPKTAQLKAAVEAEAREQMKQIKTARRARLNATAEQRETSQDPKNERETQESHETHRHNRAHSDTTRPPSQQASLLQTQTVIRSWDDTYDDTISDVSTYATSLFSVASLASSASNLTAHSNYSLKQISSATKELYNIFHKDGELIQLYKTAVHDPGIGPERLQRNLRRLLQSYAKNLEDEQTENLEYLASRLVALKAGELARSIVAKFYCAPVEEQTRVPRMHEESFEDEKEAMLIDENIFEDLKAFRHFLVSAAAFETFRTQIQSFVVPRDNGSRQAEPKQEVNMRRESAKGAIKGSTWCSWRDKLAEAADVSLIQKDLGLASQLASNLVLDALTLMTDRACVATGLLEPPLRPEMVRLRWKCTCGDGLFSDVLELRENGAQELASRMQESTAIEVTVSAYDSLSGNQRYILPRHLRWSRNVDNNASSNKAEKSWTSANGSSSTTSASAAGGTANFGASHLRWSGSTSGSASQGKNQASSNDPLASTSVSAAACCSSPGTTKLGLMLHLMACIHNKSSSKILLQDRIEKIDTDYDLIQFLRLQYRRSRGRLRTKFSLKSVRGIHFVKFHLPMGNSVIIRPHGVSCAPLNNLSASSNTMACGCLPPKDKVEPCDSAEYQCHPVPPSTFPPVTPEHLNSLFTCQEQPNQISRWIVNQIPKRKWGELFGNMNQPAEGWGIYYEEGWDPARIAIVVFVLLSGSLLFSILWTTLKDDIQGAFGVGAWMVGIGGALLAVIVTQVDSV
ncbi:hypothetical protein BU25DRAFT_463894 [Macroventuria anomochaeta]|uniref:Uncharacterized protein n=1 Tax=Macroventuria anomochaeta TaxID=301207 RepID=A0ACB6RJ29_9PLEO|nr:uncharacterized protein BU25DRAFT_463894 [Macroventuria anomochaeta]KAF2621164.1 hypothetical protein BU25DRAFT_463894 [Macroventuria anomochaeta]